MPDPTAALSLLLLAALIEGTPWARLPIGLLAAVAMLVGGGELLPTAAIAAVGVVAARWGLALAARRSRDQLGGGSAQVRAHREALRRGLASSPAYARTTFTLAAIPGVPASFIFPLLG